MHLGLILESCFLDLHDSSTPASDTKRPQGANVDSSDQITFVLTHSMLWQKYAITLFLFVCFVFFFFE